MPLELTAYHLVGLPLLGVAAGAFGTLLGVGGGFILVPVLLLLFPTSSSATITSISLAVVFLNTASGTWGYHRQGRIDFRTGTLLASGAVPAGVVGALLTRLVSRSQFELIFGFVMILGALYMFWRGTKLEPSSISMASASQRHNRSIRTRGGDSYLFRVSEPALVLLSPLAGFVSGFFGIGGGVVELPLLIVLLRVPAAIATATSQFVVVFTALAGVLVHVFTGQFHQGWRRVGLMGVGALLGAQLGVYLSSRVDRRFVLWGLSLALVAGGLRQVVSGMV